MPLARPHCEPENQFLIVPVVQASFHTGGEAMGQYGQGQGFDVIWNHIGAPADGGRSLHWRDSVGEEFIHVRFETGLDRDTGTAVDDPRSYSKNLFTRAHRVAIQRAVGKGRVRS